MRAQVGFNILFPLGMVLATSLAACAPPTQASQPPDLRETAAFEATAMIEKAEATAIVMQAQTKAASLLDTTNKNANQPSTTPAPSILATKKSGSPGLTATIQEEKVENEPTETPNTQMVEVLGVGFAADSVMIIVDFRAPPEVAANWYQGNVFVMNEVTGQKFSEVPVTPVIGPLFARPKIAGQTGYFMLMNAPPPALKAGDVVTVVMGDFKQEHVVVQ